MRGNDLEGKQIGYWKVGKPLSKNGRKFFHCVCVCGKEKDVSSSVLNTGRSLSCGCKSKVGKVEDITGQDRGWLHIEEKLEIDSRTFWRCHCKCGRNIIISQHQINDCNMRSCGCKGYFPDTIKKSLKPYCIDGTYLPVIQKDIIKKNNSSGCTGVSFRKDRNKYRAYIKFQRKNIFLGNYDTYEDAVAVRKLAEEIYFGKYRENKEEKAREE